MWVPCCFNSIKVRLEHSATIDNIVANTFQFHKATIRTSRLLPQSWVTLRFNSIKVRLERYTGHKIKKSVLTFQFHKGTIRTYTNHKQNLYFARFQFHKGTIRTLLPAQVLPTSCCFNSIKVRLEHGSTSHSSAIRYVSIP